MVKAALSVPSWLQDEMSTGPEHTEEDLLTAISKLRAELYPRSADKAPEPGNAQTMLNALQKTGAFKSLTIQQVKKIDAKAVRNEHREEEQHRREEEERRLAQEAAQMEQEREEQDAGRAEMPRTDPLQCKISGDGLTQACARQPAYFWVEGFDSKGRRRPVGGDTFFVAVRGPSRAKARVTDNGDGTYLVLWKPWCSGLYQVAISLFGVLLPGAPFNINVVTTLPCPSKCLARGSALTQAISRHTHVFEVLFKDRLGQTASAVELDVFVEPVSATSPRGRPGPVLEKEPEPDPVPAIKRPLGTSSMQESATAMTQKGGTKSRRGNASPRAQRPGEKSKGIKGCAAAVAPAPAEHGHQEDEEAIAESPTAAREEQDEEQRKSVDTKYRKLRVKVGERPLILRKDADKDSRMIGRLMPGAVVTVIEERVAPNGEVRACVSLDSVGDAIDGLLPDVGAPSVAASLPRLESCSRSRASPAIHHPSNKTPHGRTHGERHSDTVSHGRCSSLSKRTLMDWMDTRPPPPSRLPPPSSVTSERRPASARSSKRPTTTDTPRRGGDGKETHLPLVPYLQTDEAATDIADEPEFYGDDGDEAAMLAEVGDDAPSVGWVTLRKEGNRKLVTSRVKLGPGSRRQYTSQWVRRTENNKRESRKAGSLDVARLSTELTSDPTGIGFGFGGVEPGVLHAHGKLHEVHKVSYSIGLAGQYFLHVRLRQQAMPIPGSPFLLNVEPAPAHGHSSRLPPGPIRGMVGLGQEAGCVAVLRTADKMGNMCIQGKADLKISCDNAGIESEVEDHGDGSYTLRWRSKYSGSFRTHVTIDRIDCVGSPTVVQLTSSTPELSKSELEGAGLKGAVAGDKASVRIKFLDQFANVAIPPPSMRFGLAFLKEKEKLTATAPCHPFEQEWEAGDTGVCELKYIATNAGACGLHIWCDPNSTDERIPFPGSPFPVHVSAGRASPQVSVVDTWTKIVKEEKSLNKAAQQGVTDPKLLYAGDTISIRPQVFDAFSNAAQLEEGALEVSHEAPSGEKVAMPFTVNSRGGQTTYDIRHDTTTAGVHKVHVTIHGAHIKGSPMSFKVHADKPDPPNCKISGLAGGQLKANEQGRFLLLKTFDRFNNEVDSGGLSVTYRLQLVKQGVHDQTALIPSNHKVEVEDMEDGTYTSFEQCHHPQRIHVFFQMPCVTKLIVNMDKNMPSNVAELPPITLHCVEDPAEATDTDAGKAVPALQRQATKSSLNAESSLGSGRSTASKGNDDLNRQRDNTRLKSAASEMMLGFGTAEERRDKDGLIVAAEAFAEGAETFKFDKLASEALKGELKRQHSKVKKSAKGMLGGLFEKS